jgi:hypothetical protein
MSDEQQNKKRKVTSGLSGKLDVPLLHNLLIKKHSERARVPTRGSALAAGYDLYRLDSAHVFTWGTLDSYVSQRREESHPSSGESRR